MNIDLLKLKAAMTNQGPSFADPPVPTKNLLNSGSTLLNLAASGRTAGAFAKGRYFFVVGDSSSGKTWLCMTCFAEACRNKNFKDHRLIFDDAEDGALMDKTRFFGQAVTDKVEAPAYDADGKPLCSETLDDFYYNIGDALDQGRPFIYVLDSMDVLVTDQERKKAAERKAYRRRPKGKAPAGEMMDGKAKRNSSGMRDVIARLKKTESILIVLCQTRDNVDNFSFAEKTRAGGHALKFYAALEIWTSIAKRLKKTVRGQELQVGIVCKAAVKKNRLSGKEWTVEIPLYHTYGIDDIGSMVDYLVKYKHWTCSDEGVVKAAEFDFSGKRDRLIKKVEDESLERDLKALVADVWAEVEEAAALDRKPRYE